MKCYLSYHVCFREVEELFSVIIILPPLVYILPVKPLVCELSGETIRIPRRRSTE